MGLTPDFVMGSTKSLINVLSKDLPTWSAQITMLSGSWLRKTTDRGFVTLELTTYGGFENLLATETKVVEALESIGVEEIVTGGNQRGKSGDERHSFIFYRPVEE